jgi:hypothetical protein
MVTNEVKEVVSDVARLCQGQVPVDTRNTKSHIVRTICRVGTLNRPAGQKGSRSDMTAAISVDSADPYLSGSPERAVMP